MFDTVGFSLYSLGNYAGALPYYGKVLALEPNDYVTLNNKGLALYYLGNYSGALPYYERALAVAPNYTNALAY